MERARYVFDKDVFVRNVADLRESCARTGMRTILAYSVKTNPHRAVLDAVREAGMYAEVVSPYEYRLVAGIGFPLERIIYNGVIPDPAGKAKAAACGGIVNVDSFYELEQIDRKAHDSGQMIEVGIRVCPEVQNGIQSRFGVAPGSDEYEAMVGLARDSGWTSISGIHCHSTGARDLPRWKMKVWQMMRLARGIGARYVDLGSNFYGPMDPRMAEQFQTEIPGFGDYASLIAEALSVVYGNDTGSWPCIILEPGTPVVADTVSIEAEVLNIRVTNGRTIATVNCSVYDCGFAYLTKRIPFDVEHMGSGERYSDVDICGHTCVEIDRLYDGYTGELAIGDKLIFRNLGAYSVSMSNWFIEPPLELVVKGEGSNGVPDEKVQRDTRP